MVDLVGQKKTEWLAEAIVFSFLIIACLLGLYTSSFRVAFIFLLFGAILAAVIVVPDWPMWNRNPIEFREPKGAKVVETKKRR